MNAATTTLPVLSQDQPAAHDLRIYDVADGELETLERILRELALPMMPDYGIKAIGFWADPGSCTLYQISRHDSREVIEGNWDRFHSDPRWAVGLKALRQERTIVRSVKTLVVVGIAGLPPFVDASAA